MKKPDFVVVGAAKCGTTSLFHYLNEHPAIFVPKSKEISYFVGNEGPGRVAGLDEYLSFFGAAGEQQKIGEVSTAYLYGATAAADIANSLGRDIKIIIILRNPVDFVQSLWGQNTRDGGETLSLDAALEMESQRMRDPDFGKNISGWRYNYAYTDRARYAPQVQRYLEVFGKENVAVFIFEEFFTDIETSMRELFRFIGVDPEYRIKRAVRHNTQGRARWQWLHRLYFENSRVAEAFRRVTPARFRRAIMMFLYRLNTKASPRLALEDSQYARLCKMFEPDIRELENMLGKDLSSIWTCTGDRK